MCEGCLGVGRGVGITIHRIMIDILMMTSNLQVKICNADNSRKGINLTMKGGNLDATTSQ